MYLLISWDTEWGIDVVGQFDTEDAALKALAEVFDEAVEGADEEYCWLGKNFGYVNKDDFKIEWLVYHLED